MNVRNGVREVHGMDLLPSLPLSVVRRREPTPAGASHARGLTERLRGGRIGPVSTAEPRHGRRRSSSFRGVLGGIGRGWPPLSEQRASFVSRSRPSRAAPSIA